MSIRARKAKSAQICRPDRPTFGAGPTKAKVPTSTRPTNAEYLLNTVDHLDGLGIEDAPLHALAARVRSHRPG